MYFKFNINQPNTTGNPDYILCGQGISPINRDDNSYHTVLVITVDGSDEIVFYDLFETEDDTFDDGTGLYVGFGGFTPITTTNGFVVEGLKKTGTLQLPKFELILSGITPYKPLDINFKIVSDNHLVTYQEIFRVFGEDLPYVDTEYIPIVLINETDNYIDGVQTKPFSSLFAWRQPFTDKVYFVNTNSSQNKHYLLDSSNNILSKVNTGFICSKEDIDLKMSNILVNESECISDAITVFKRTDIPEFRSSINTTINNSEETIILEENTIQTDIDTNILSKFYLNNVLDTFVQYINTNVSPEYHIYLKYKLYDYAGTLYWESDELDLDINNLNVNDTIQTFNVPTIGDFFIKTELYYSQDGIDIFLAYHSYKIVGNMFSEIKQEDCAKYSINNYTNSELTLSVYKLKSVISTFDDNSNFDLIDTYTIDSLSKIFVTLDEDSVYKFYIEMSDDSSKNLTYVIVNSCKLLQCLDTQLNKLICCSCNDKCKTKDSYNFMSLMLNSMAYFNMINQEYKLNYVYESLSPNKLKELYTIQTFLDRTKEYCLECTTKCKCGCSK